MAQARKRLYRAAAARRRNCRAPPRLISSLTGDTPVSTSLVGRCLGRNTIVNTIVAWRTVRDHGSR
jgi:hypothetical protein